jgi:pimeloyl-ACP methyl ester carboxylesterase
MEQPHRLETSDGTSLAYWLRRSGPRQASLLLLVHGAASNHTRWSEFVEHTTLKDSWDLLLPDMRGNGDSMYRGRLDLETWSQDLIEILDAECYPRALVVGHSLGAQIALDLAGRHLERTSGLVLIDPVFPSALRRQERRLIRLRPLFVVTVGIIRLLNSIGLRRKRIPNRDLRVLDQETRRALLAPGMTEEMAKRYRSPRLILGFMPTANYLQQLIATVAPLPELEAVAVPVLVLLSVGTSLADPRITHDSISRFPDARVVPIEADHWPLTEKPVETREAIEEWVRRRYGEPLDSR